MASEVFSFQERSSPKAECSSIPWDRFDSCHPIQLQPSGCRSLSSPRRASCAARQPTACQPRRELERDARLAATRCARKAKEHGFTQKQVAGELRLSPRTLRDWKHREEEDGMVAQPRGRPLFLTDVATRNEVIRFLHHVTGPSVGIPALRALFPDVPRCILEDLLTRYRRVWRRRYCQRGYRLTWHRPGRVWAMDHSDPLHPVDGVYPHLFAIRDLASHQQLGWIPVNTENADETLTALDELFQCHGPPLVLKSDNGSAFIAGVTRETMQKEIVAQLFSPPRRPQYNGAVERSNGVLKTYTHQHAITCGHPFRWTSEDLEHARQLANTISRPWGHRGQSPDEAWTTRTPISQQERDAFQQALSRERQQACHDLDLDADGPLSCDDEARVGRLAIPRVLEQLGYLTKTRVQRPPRKPKRKSREKLRRALEKQREAARRAAQSPPSKAPSQSMGALSSCQTQPTNPSNANPPPMLAPSISCATIHAAADDNISEGNSPSANEPTRREWAFLSWVRRPITPLISFAKAAKIMQ